MTIQEFNSLYLVCTVFLRFGNHVLNAVLHVTKRVTPLSGQDIWINVLIEKRYAVHVNACDIWNDLRPFLKYLASYGL